MMSPTPARTCLTHLATLTDEQLAQAGKIPEVEDGERGQAAKILAAELARDLQLDTDETGRTISGRDCAQPWKAALLEFAWSDHWYEVNRFALRERALLAVATLWVGDPATVAQVEARLLVRQDQYQVGPLGRALAVLAPGSSDTRNLLIELVGAQHLVVRRQALSATPPSQAESGNKRTSNVPIATPESSNHPTSSEGGVALTLPAALQGAAHTPHVRSNAASALSQGWSGDSEAKAAILRALIGMPEAGIPPDEDRDVRGVAASALSQGWSGDSEAKAAILRALIGVPEAGIPPDGNGDVRSNAASALGQGWSGDSEAKAALRRALIGVPEAGIPPDEDRDVRGVATDALRQGWSGDSEAKAAILRALIGVPEAAVPQDEDKIVRCIATIALGEGWSGDSEAKAAILRALIGVAEAGIAPYEDRDVRSHAADALRNFWRLDREVRVAVQRAVECSAEKLGVEHERTVELRRLLSELSRGHGEDAR